jgi:hypothetical protein
MQEGLGRISSPPIGHFERPGLPLRGSSGFRDRTPLHVSIQVSGLHSDSLVCFLSNVGMRTPEDDFLARSGLGCPRQLSTSFSSCELVQLEHPESFFLSGLACSSMRTGSSLMDTSSSSIRVGRDSASWPKSILKHSRARGPSISGLEPRLLNKQRH